MKKCLKFISAGHNSQPDVPPPTTSNLPCPTEWPLFDSKLLSERAFIKAVYKL